MSAPPAMPRRRLEAMQAGRERARKERRKEAVRRVRAYRAWLAAGSPLRSIPEIPSSADFRLAGQVRR